MKPFQSMCSTLAAVHCYNNGQTVKQIAKAAQRVPSTIYRWFKRDGFVLRDRKCVRYRGE
jgi:transposase